jgi:hypothetical protein
VSSEREELHPLIQELPEEEVPAVLGAARVSPLRRNKPGVAASLVRRYPWPDL